MRSLVLVALIGKLVTTASVWLCRPDRGGARALIALEEHYTWDPASVGNVVGTWLRSNNTVAYQRLYDRGALRLEQMDAAKLAHHGVGHRREGKADGQEHRAQGP